VPAASKLSIGAAAHSAGTSAAPPPKNIPVRNLTPPPAKKANAVLKYAKVAAVVAVVAVGGYFGFKFIMDYQAKQNEKSAKEARNSSGESQVGHISALNDVLDATEPGHYRDLRDKGRSSGPRQRGGAGGKDVAVPDEDEGGMKAAAAEKQLPIVPPVWTSELKQAKIPEARANGTISGTNFVVETAKVETVSTAQVLRLFEGTSTSPEREMLVYLHLKPGEKLGGQTLEISSDMKGAGVPQVAKRWKTNPKFAPTLKSFNSGYVMKLELAQMTNNAIPGKIYLALPDAEQSVVAGMFKITSPAFEFDMPTTPTATPVAAPKTAPTAADRAFQQRYGVQK